jgi:small subunit ribosomal protein S17
VTENEDQQSQEQQPEAQEPEAEVPAADAEAPSEEPAAEEPAADQAAAEEPAAEQPPAEEPAAEEAAADAPAAEQAGEAAPADGEDEEPLTPKQKRKLERSRATGPARAQQSPEERARERAGARAGKAAARGRWHAKQRDRKAGRPAAEPQPQEPRARGARKERRGVVVSSKPDKTITVRIDVMRPHPMYGKVVRNTSTLHAHDEKNQANEGDVVRVVECRPLSRTKRWRLLEVLERAR